MDRVDAILLAIVGKDGGVRRVAAEVDRRGLLVVSARASGRRAGELELLGVVAQLVAHLLHHEFLRASRAARRGAQRHQVDLFGVALRADRRGRVSAQRDAGQRGLDARDVHARRVDQELGLGRGLRGTRGEGCRQRRGVRVVDAAAIPHTAVTAVALHGRVDREVGLGRRVVEVDDSVEAVEVAQRIADVLVVTEEIPVDLVVLGVLVVPAGSPVQRVGVGVLTVSKDSRVRVQQDRPVARTDQLTRLDALPPRAAVDDAVVDLPLAGVAQRGRALDAHEVEVASSRRGGTDVRSVRRGVPHTAVGSVVANEDVALRVDVVAGLGGAGERVVARVTELRVVDVVELVDRLRRGSRRNVVDDVESVGELGVNLRTQTGVVVDRVGGAAELDAVTVGVANDLNSHD